MDIFSLSAECPNRKREKGREKIERKRERAKERKEKHCICTFLCT